MKGSTVLGIANFVTTAGLLSQGEFTSLAWFWLGMILTAVYVTTKEDEKNSN